MNVSVFMFGCACLCVYVFTCVYVSKQSMPQEVNFHAMQLHCTKFSVTTESLFQL